MASPVQEIGVAEVDIGAETETPTSAVSWAAIVAGAVAAAAVSLILMVLGSGLGLSIVSPWSNSGVNAATFAVSTVVWLIIIQWVASGVGGYLTGRLRTRWTGVHTDEVFFRDTAHGLLTWALATVVVAGLLGSVVSSIVGGGVQATATVASGVAQGAAQAAARPTDTIADPTGYFVDVLFRPAGPATSVPATTGENQGALAEAARILVNGSAAGEFPAADKTYLVQLVAARSGGSPADAQKRVDDVIAQMQAAKLKAKEAADQARKTAATLSISTFLALLIGAFIASVAAALGGTQRDQP